MTKAITIAEARAKEILEAFYNITYKDGRALDFKLAIIKHELLVKAGRKGLDSIERAKKCSVAALDLAISHADPRAEQFLEAVQEAIKNI